MHPTLVFSFNGVTSFLCSFVFFFPNKCPKPIALKKNLFFPPFISMKITSNPNQQGSLLSLESMRRRGSSQDLNCFISYPQPLDQLNVLTLHFFGLFHSQRNCCSLFTLVCWPCLPRQGYCVQQIHYRIQQLKGFWPLGNNNRSIFI